METIELIAADGMRLSAARFAPQGEAHAVAVVPAAMGVKQDFYEPFARFLAEQGVAVLTFDYRGMGRSIPHAFRGSLRGFRANLFDWAERDYNAALHAARSWQPEKPLFVVGHSLGAQLPGLVPDNHLIDGIVTVAAGTGYWRYNAPQLRRIVWFMWYVAVPLYTRLFGYFPGKRVRKVGDLPKGVIFQWSRWCRSPHYVIDEQGRPLREGFERLRIPMLSMSFSDDEMMTARGIDHLHGFYRNARIERHAIAPADVGAQRIGHFGFFREQFRDSLWRQALDWMRRHAAAHTPAGAA